MEPAPTALPTGIRFEGRYEILGELGSGSFGRVYRARQRSTGKSVAIKLLSPREGTAESTGREADRFRRETQIGAALSHPNIVELMDSGETPDGQLYAVFAHVPGETLEQALAREERLGVREAVRLMTQVLDALAAAHAQGIVHRDLKPANLMLSGTGARRNALVLDFGLGGLAEGRRRQEWQTLTQTREFLGTPLYASPEQLAGEAATPRSDLYAWGLVFLECLTGRHPFAEAGAMERLLTGGGAVEIPDWLRRHRLGDLLERVTARDPAKRDMADEGLIEALDAIAGGGELPVPPEAMASRRPAPLSQRGELRHLTVMFCDLVDSSGLAQRLEAESYRDVVRAYHARATGAVERHAGHVAQYLGDGLLVYFGHPHAHEDDAERAVRAGREILRGLAALNPRLEAEHGVTVAARVGIHTGPVVVGDLGSGARKETLALGDTPNIAARLEALADPGTLLISGATQGLVSGLFVTEDLGTPALKGISEPIPVHRVVGPSGVSSRLDRAPSLTAFVGREQELALLEARFQQARDGEGQAVLISGEAGIGKSRLLHELRGNLRATPHVWLECQSSAYTQRSAFQPLIELLEQALGVDERQPVEERIERLERGVVTAGLGAEEAVPLLAGLLSLRLPERYAPLQMSPQLQRQKTLETLLAWALALGDEQPVVLVAEDVHWADASTLEWVGLVIEQCATVPVLLVVSFRPDFEAPWRPREHLLPLTLGRLRSREASELGRGAAAGAQLSDSLLQALVARADGVPLFIEELAKAVVDSGQDTRRSLSGLAIPETLHDLLMARLDRLGDAKQLAQIGAAMGREFPYGLLERVAPANESMLREGLGKLVEAQLLHQRGLPPNASYIFRHALIQDAAYQSLLSSQRQEIHGRIADALEAHLPERAAREPELVAHHCEAAGRTDEAIACYLRAGERATQRSAHVEAVAHLERAIGLLGTLPESPERNQHEIRLQLALGAPLQATRGMYASEVENAYERALELSRNLADGSERFRGLAGLAIYYRNREVNRAVALGEELLAYAERSGDPSQRLFAHSTLGVSLHYRGELSKALRHDEQAITLFDAANQALLESVYGVDPGIVSLCLASFAQLQLGYPDSALKRVEEAIERARGCTHAYSLAYSLNWAAIVGYLRGEPQRVLERTDEAIDLSTQRGFAQQLNGALFFRAWALAADADAKTAGRALETVVMNPSAAPPVAAPFVAAVCDAQRILERLDVALRILEAALTRWAEIEAPYWDAEFLRLKGEIRLAQDADARVEAEGLFFRAIEIARHQEGRSLELRAATSLARLWRRQGRREAACAILGPVYEWFGEGFDTADLKDAKALLEELN